MYSLLASTQKTSTQELPTLKQIEDHFDGHICRCTGYLAIWRCMHSFAIDAPQELKETLGKQNKDMNIAPLSPTQDSWLTPARKLKFDVDGYTYYQPTTLHDLCKLMVAHSRTHTKLLNGNTSVGIYKKNVDDPKVIFDISRIPNLFLYEVHESKVNVGAGLTFTDFLERLDCLLTTRGDDTILRAVQKLVRRVAGVQVRSRGTLGGMIVPLPEHASASCLVPNRPQNVFMIVYLSTIIASFSCRKHHARSESCTGGPWFALSI